MNDDIFSPTILSGTTQLQFDWSFPGDHVSTLDNESQTKKYKEIGYNLSIQEDSITYCERLLSEQGFLTFMGDKLTGSTKIESSSDVAFLFKNLESAATENAFAVFLKEDATYSVLYLSTGSTKSAIIDIKLIVAAAHELSASEVIFVHNHPAGTLTPSIEDYRVHEALSKSFVGTDIEVKDSIIINLDSGQYVVFGEADYSTSFKNDPPVEIIETKVYMFDRQLLYVPSSEKYKITGSKDIATFLSIQKRGLVPKIQMMVLGQDNTINRYVALVPDFNINELLVRITNEVGKHGEQIILASNGIIDEKTSQLMQSALKKSEIRLLDVLAIKQDEDILNNYVSYADTNVLEPTATYGTVLEQNSFSLSSNQKKNVPLKKIFMSLTFDDYRSRISIAEMAEHLGYWRNPSGGISKPSYCLGDKKNPQEEIVIYNINNPAKQTYFNRKGTDKGNLINFVENRLDQFSKYTTEKGFKGVKEVLGKYLNSPEFIQRPQNVSSPQAKEFNIHTLNPRPLKAGNSYLIDRRKLSPKTVDDFRSRVLLYTVGKNNHVGFPYRTWPEMAINNFEMRNYFPTDNQNYKGFPAGGNRTSACWVGTFVPDNCVTDIYIFESCIDAMSFYEMKHFTKETTAAFVSVGGTVTQNQITPLQQRFPNVKWHSCMDNDVSGNIFDVSIAHYLKGENFKGYANKTPEQEGKIVHLISNSGKEITIHEDYFSSAIFFKENNIEGLEIIKPGRGKDWNELLTYYKRFDLNLSPSAKIAMSMDETISQLDLRGYHNLTAAIEKHSDEIISKIISKETNFSTSIPIAETNAYSMVMDCNLRMKCAEFIVEPTNLYFVDKATQQQMSGQPFRDSLSKENVNLLKDFHSNDLRTFLEKNTLSIKKGGVEKRFEKTISPSGWGLKEATLLKKNTLDLGNCL